MYKVQYKHFSYFVLSRGPKECGRKRSWYRGEVNNSNMNTCLSLSLSFSLLTLGVLELNHVTSLTSTFAGRILLLCPFTPLSGYGGSIAKILDFFFNAICCSHVSSFQNWVTCLLIKSGSKFYEMRNLGLRIPIEIPIFCKRPNFHLNWRFWELEYLKRWFWYHLIL